MAHKMPAPTFQENWEELFHPLHEIDIHGLSERKVKMMVRMMNKCGRPLLLGKDIDEKLIILQKGKRARGNSYSFSRSKQLLGVY